MNNPFEHNSKTLPSGFYFDKKKGLICFYYADDEEEMSFFSSSKIYNRIIGNSRTPLFMKEPNERKVESNIEDLVELELELLEDKGGLMSDFKWITSSKATYVAFIEYLLSEEKYLVLEVFKMYVEQYKDKK